MNRKIEVICLQCKKKLLVYPCRYKSFKFCSRSCQGKYYAPKFKFSNRGCKFSNEHRTKIGESKIGKKRTPFSEQCIKNMSEAHKKPRVAIFCKRCGKSIEHSPYEEKFRKFCSIRCNLIAMGSGRPNGAEQVLLNLLNQYFPNEWKYVGDYQVWFGKKNPDFINVNGKKKLIELFGRIHHKKEEEIPRIEHFKQFGFDTLVIWADELRNKESLKEKLINFSGAIK